MHGKSEQRSLFSIIERGATCKGFPEPEVSAYERSPRQQIWLADRVPHSCQRDTPPTQIIIAPLYWTLRAQAHQAEQAGIFFGIHWLTSPLVFGK